MLFRSGGAAAGVGGGCGGCVADSTAAAAAAVPVTGALTTGDAIVVAAAAATGTEIGDGLATTGGKGAVFGAMPKETVFFTGLGVMSVGVGAISLVSGAELLSFLSTIGENSELGVELAGDELLTNRGDANVTILLKPD